jgi:hypothetical protein
LLYMNADLFQLRCSSLQTWHDKRCESSLLFLVKTT